MDVSEKLMLQLLRSGLWNREVDFCCGDMEAINWQEVLAVAQKQTVLGVVGDGIDALPEQLKPDKDLLIRLYTTAYRNAQLHEFMNGVIAELFGVLEQYGVHGVLLKGQGMAMNYPDPTKRGCGDIDLYVEPGDYPAARNAFVDSGILTGPFREEMHHLEFSYKGVRVEIHWTPTSYYNWANFRYLPDWSRDLLKRECCRKVLFENQVVCLPPVRFDAFFIFYHIYQHLFVGGVGLRQLCDWAVYLHRFRDEIDRELLSRDLRKMKVLNMWKILGCIAVDFLGLPQEEFPFYDGSCVQKARFLMNHVILRSGNFGQYGDNDEGQCKYFRMKHFKMVGRKMNHQKKILKFMNSEILSFWGYYLYRGIISVARRNKRRRN